MSSANTNVLSHVHVFVSICAWSIQLLFVYVHCTCTSGYHAQVHYSRGGGVVTEHFTVGMFVKNN